MNDAHRTPFACSFDAVDGEAIISARGEVDAHTGPQLWTCIEKATGINDRVVFDLSGVSFMDSTGISVIARAYDRLGRQPASIVLRHPQRPVLRLMKITGFDQCMTVEHSLPG